MRPLDLVATARLLAEHPRRGRPLEANLRKAIRTAYYAMFHCLAENCADMMVGGPSARKSKEAWLQVYRSLDHGVARRRCRDQSTMSRFPTLVHDFADVLVKMQDLRHTADYDPLASIPTRDEVVQLITDAENAIRQFPNAPIVNRRAFAVHVLMSGRRN